MPAPARTRAPGPARARDRVSAATREDLLDGLIGTVQPPGRRMKDRFTAKESGLLVLPPGSELLSSEPGPGRVRPTIHRCLRLTAHGRQETSPRAENKSVLHLHPPHILPSQAPVRPRRRSPSANMTLVSPHLLRDRSEQVHKEETEALTTSNLCHVPR